MDWTRLMPYESDILMPFFYCTVQWSLWTEFLRCVYIKKYKIIILTTPTDEGINQMDINMGYLSKFVIPRDRLLLKEKSIDTITCNSSLDHRRRIGFHDCNSKFLYKNNMRQITVGSSDNNPLMFKSDRCWRRTKCR